ncbi:uncharacterized protein LOC125224717 [Leguminivora glycinivorella]|uniref:uncharacterized protein LOC125224717 n=1 Tax=Leguminivora glycinivorella TaxID=1035111 RepID=UPI00200D6087|nr:uncharacterized protein LOC125224717 [Leguminivora glycinivorella]
MEVAVFFVCMAIIAQIYAAPTPESGSIADQKNEFELPPMARGGFTMTLHVTVSTTASTSNKLKVKMLPTAEDDNEPIPEYCKNNNIEGKHICVMPNQEWTNRSAETQEIIDQVIGITADRMDNRLILGVELNGNNHGVTLMDLADFEKLKHFSVGGIKEIKKLEFEFKHEYQ